MTFRRGTNSQAWAKSILELRLNLQLTQGQLADKIGVTAMTVSRWERGLVQPTASGYISLGNLAPAEEAWDFWRRAGLDRQKVLVSLDHHNSGKGKPKSRARSSRMS